MGKDRRSYKQWSCEETAALHRGVQRYKRHWILILTDPELAPVLSGRAAVQLKDKWRNIQKCEKRRSVPSREASQPSRWSINSTPAGRTRRPDSTVAELDLLPEDSPFQQRRSRRFTAGTRKRYAESDSASGEEDADDEDFQCKFQDEEPEGSSAGEEEQTVSESTHAHRAVRAPALAGSHTAAQSPGLSLRQPVAVSQRRIVTARAGPSLGPAGTQLALPGVAMIDTLHSGDSEQSFLLGAFQAAPRQQEGPAALLSPPQGLLHASPVQAPPLQPPQHCSAELLQALMRSAGATRQRGLHQDTLCGALPVQYLQRPQQQLWRGRGGADTAVAHGLEGAAMACAPPVRHLSPQGPWPSAVPVDLSYVDMCGPVSNVAVSSSLEVLSCPLSMPLVRRVHSKMPCPVRGLIALPGSVAAEEVQSVSCNACTACCHVPGSAPVGHSSSHPTLPAYSRIPSAIVCARCSLARPMQAPQGGIESLRWQSGSPQPGGRFPAAQLPAFAGHAWSSPSCAWSGTPLPLLF